jgi:phage shock protein A
MSESVTNRVGRIISGSINAMVDAVEGSAPEMVMEQAIREIDGAVDEVRTELGKIIASKHLANKRLAEKNSKHEDLADKIELAIKEKRDDLAEAAISAQLDIEAQVPVLENTISECSEKEKELEGYITALQAKKREMREDLKQFQQSKEEAVANARVDENGKVLPSSQVKIDQAVDRAGSAFDRVLEKQTGVPSTGGAADAENTQKLAELEDISRKNRIQERLTSIKSSSSS